MINASSSGASSWSSTPFPFSEFWSNVGPVRSILSLLVTEFVLFQVLSVISASSRLAACGAIFGVFFEIEQAHLRHWQTVNQSNSLKWRIHPPQVLQLHPKGTVIWPGYSCNCSGRGLATPPVQFTSPHCSVTTRCQISSFQLYNAGTCLQPCPCLAGVKFYSRYLEPVWLAD